MFLDAVTGERVLQGDAAIKWRTAHWGCDTPQGPGFTVPKRTKFQESHKHGL